MGRKIKHPFTFSLLLIILLFYSSRCNTTEPPDPPPPPPPVVEEPILTLELDDAHCTEAWINLTTEKLTLPAELTLKQYNPAGDSVTKNISLNTADTLFYIDSLLPNQTYSYQVSGIWYPKPDSQQQVSSIKLPVTTMDTTSHNFTFEMITFGGEIGSSVLYDVAIIDENNIWAVGDIWIKDDTSSLGYTKYNAVHWDGSQWKLYQIMFYTICGQLDKTPYPAGSVFAFNENEILIAMDGDQIVRLEGVNQEEIQCLPYSFSIKKFWGTSLTNIYAVGDRGNIAHYNGSGWTKIESGTTLNINDIWGDYNQKTQEWEMLAVASNYMADWDKEILSIENNNVEKLTTLTNPPMEPLLTTWFVPGKQYYVAGAGIYQKRLLSDSLWKNNEFNITTFATTSIRGNNINDIGAVGAFGDFLHFNGVNWRQYQEPYLYNGAYTKVSIKDNLVIAVGGNQISIASEAVILIGRR